MVSYVKTYASFRMYGYWASKKDHWMFPIYGATLYFCLLVFQVVSVGKLSASSFWKVVALQRPREKSLPKILYGIVKIAQRLQSSFQLYQSLWRFINFLQRIVWYLEGSFQETSTWRLLRLWEGVCDCILVDWK